MANVHGVRISGLLPFNWMDEAPELLLKEVARMGTPHYGLRLSYGRKELYVPSQYGGKTLVYPFTIMGSEAISMAGLRSMIEEIEQAGGAVQIAAARDEENNEPWTKLIA